MDLAQASRIASLIPHAFLRMFGLFFCAAAVYGASFIIAGYRRGRAARSWRRTHGNVVSSKVEVHEGYESATSFVPLVQYKFVVDGQEHLSSEFSCAYLSGDEEGARAIVARYPVGKAVVVFYDPSNPSAAVLVSGGNTPMTMLGLVAFACLFAIGAWFAVAGAP